MTPASLVRDLIALSVQIAVVGGAVAVLVACLAVPARARYLGLRLALAASLVAPWLLRASEIPAPVAATLDTLNTPFVPMPVDSAPSSDPLSSKAAVPTTSTRVIPWTEIALGVAAAGIVVRGIWLAVGLRRLRRLRNRSVAIDVLDYEDLQRRIGTRARIAEVTGLMQPATFGVRRPMVLLPDALAAAPASLRRAVVTHELFHVRRRDWLSVLAEEAIRTLFWFHPAIYWLTSSIQLAREEIVDELSVRHTGDRRTYMQALMAFADTGGLHSAPAFAHRRQLFRRILSVSKEKVMSRSRIAMSAGALVTVVFGTAWYASTLFPIVSAAKADWITEAGSQSASAAMSPVRLSRARAGLDGQRQAQTPPPARVLVDPDSGEVLAQPVTPENPIPRRTRNVVPAWPSQFAGEQLQIVVGARVRVERDGTVSRVFRDQCSASTETVCQAFFDASAAAIRQWRYARPVQSPIQFTVMVAFRSGSNPVITQAASDWLTYARETQPSLRLLAENTGGTTALRSANLTTGDLFREELAELTARYREVERSLRLAVERLNSAHPDVLKLQSELAQLNDQLGRTQQEMVRAGVLQNEALQRDADLLRASVRQAEAAVQEARVARERVNEQPLRSASGKAPLRITGGMERPRVLVQTRPTYTQEAMAARAEGTVVLEVLVDEQGIVGDARVLNSIPVLDESALTTIKQWRFTPTVINGEPTPVIVRVEMMFTLK